MSEGCTFALWNLVASSCKTEEEEVTVAVTGSYTAVLLSDHGSNLWAIRRLIVAISVEVQLSKAPEHFLQTELTDGPSLEHQILHSYMSV